MHEPAAHSHPRPAWPEGQLNSLAAKTHSQTAAPLPPPPSSLSILLIEGSFPAQLLTYACGREGRSCFDPYVKEFRPYLKSVRFLEKPTPLRRIPSSDSLAVFFSEFCSLAVPNFCSRASLHSSAACVVVMHDIEITNIAIILKLWSLCSSMKAAFDIPYETRGITQVVYMVHALPYLVVDL